MIMFTDQSAAFGGKAYSPAITLLHQNDFGRILDLIADGTIPTATGQPFDVNYDLKQPGGEVPPWMTAGNPWANK
jgi:hypothetical protein